MKIISLLAFVVGIFLSVPTLVFASTLYLSPGKTTIPIGGTVAVSVRLNAGGDSVNAVSAFLSYPADKLDVAYVSPGSVFAIGAENSYGGGIIKISRGSLSGVSGNVGVATIGFRGKSAGAANVSFIGGSSAPRASDSSESLNLGGSAGGTFTVGGTAAVPSPKASTTTSTTKPIQTITPQLSISDVQISSVASGSATISWKTNVEADSMVEYGLDKNVYFLDEVSEKLTLTHQIKLENPMMVPGLKFHFRVKSKDGSGNISTGEDQEFQIPGFQVIVKVVDDNGNPLSGVEVLLYSDPLRAVTNANGEAIFENVPEGKHLAVVKTMGAEKTAEINVLGTNSSKQGNNTSIKIGKIDAVSSELFAVSQSKWVTFFAVVFSTILILGIVLLIMKKKYHLKQKDQTDSG